MEENGCYLRIYGAIYNGVPTNENYAASSILSTILANPKSDIFAIPSHF